MAEAQLLHLSLASLGIAWHRLASLGIVSGLKAIAFCLDAAQSVLS